MIETGKKTTKLCLVVTLGEPGGAQKYVYDLATHLDPEAFDVTVCYGGQPTTWLGTQITGKGIATHFFSMLKRSISPFADSLAVLQMAWYFRKQSFDIVHFNSSKAGILGPIAARLAGVKKVYFTCHGWAFDDPRPTWERKLYIYLHRFVSHFTTNIICVSEYSRQAGIAIGLNNKRLVTINNSYDLKQLPQITKQQARTDLQQRFDLPKKPIVGTIANYYLTKGLSYLLEAAAQLEKDSSDYIYCLIGNGDEQKTMTRFIEANGLEETVFLLNGVLDAGKYIPAFDLFVLPSLKEGFPYVLLEAMAAGVPIVATDVGGVPEALRIYPNDYYSLIPSKDSNALANAIAEKTKTTELPVATLSQVRDLIDIQNMITSTVNVYQS